MTHILVAGKIHGDGVALLRDAPGFTVDVVDEGPDEAYLPLLPAADGLLVRTQPLGQTDIAAAPALKIVSRHGVGFDAVDVPALNERGIPLTIVGDVNSRSVAEHAMMLILACAKRLVRSDNATRQDEWDYRNRFESVEIYGRTLLICGFGRIGRLVAKMAEGFGMNVVAFDPFQSADDIRAVGVQAADDLNAALKTADFVTIHAPKMGDKPLIGAEQFTHMKPDAFVINTSRGGLVDEPALISALDAGYLAGAGLDVFLSEPPAADDPLLTDDRLIFTPHTAGIAAECARRMSIMAAQNILDYFSGKLDPALVVNKDAIGSNNLVPGS